MCTYKDYTPSLMKKLSILAIAFYIFLASCGTTKIDCADARYFYVIFSVSGTEGPGKTDSTDTDSLAVVTRYAKNTGMKQPVSIDTFRTGAHSTSKIIRLSDKYADKFNWDYGINFIQTGRQYELTEITTSDYGHSTFGVCFKDLSFKVNGKAYLVKTKSDAHYCQIKF